MSFGWADLSSLASNLAEKGTNFLAELDERIEGDEIEDNRDIGSDGDEKYDEDFPSWSRKSDKSAEKETEFSQEKAAPATPSGSESSDSSGNPQKLKDIQALQDALSQVKGMREELKNDVTGQMQQMSQEMQGAIATLGSKKGDPAGAGSAGTADASLLARAQLAEERLSSAEAALGKLRASLQANRAEVEAAREAEQQFAKHKVKMQALMQEKEQAEMALKNLTNMQSSEREELTQQVQDLQSKASSERHYGQSKAEECEVLKAQLAAAAEQMAQTAAKHEAALSSAQRASEAVEPQGDYEGMRVRLETQDACRTARAGAARNACTTRHLHQDRCGIREAER